MSYLVLITHWLPCCCCYSSFNDDETSIAVPRRTLTFYDYNRAPPPSSSSCETPCWIQHKDRLMKKYGSSLSTQQQTTSL
ncbi:uncharacterized protein BX664DRAFT_332000 [Halteromyces radiatus]|uniref:uncharacterized protein n=1 Tax=Halteromyces radiatus TaxID=101107 RepID=UPI00221E7640|nr:uncharacterized protein BX664DRAFT_332000 [Halteromyces radiatus]KAI8089031.1 hypothetical protein BX664DRAFT_332000 [Halteromyces radiatus]